MQSDGNIESEVKSWLEVIMRKENLKNLSVNVLENSEKANGHIGDVVFVDVTGTVDSGSTRKYNLVLKCSKRSQALREQSMTEEAFLNEIYMYKTLMPIFTQFQKEKKVTDYFDSVPKCYGIYTGDNIEVIALNNLKALGYSVWEKRKPLPRSHINKVVEEYGKWHAVSIAVQLQQPETFQQIRNHFDEIARKFEKKGGANNLFRTCIKEVYDLLKDDVEERVIEKWGALEDQMDYIFGEMFSKANVKVVVHGDCWNNNFMFCYDGTDKEVLSKVAILDWQMSRIASPIVDLSYFIFTCISETDLEDMESILENYHKSFTQHLAKLGTDSSSVYSFHQLLEDWRNFCKYGILLTSLIFKICSTGVDEVIDRGEAADQGVQFFDTFLYEIKDLNNFKNRMKPIVQYGVNHGLI